MRITIESISSFKQIGRRQYQQDARYPDNDTPDSDNRVFIVCDGVGGSQKGEVASNAFCQHMADHLNTIDLNKPFSFDNLGKALFEVLKDFSNTLSETAPESATTVTMAIVHSGGIMLAHAGDSRIYHVRPGVGIMYRSSDDSLVNALIHSGNLTPQEGVNNPRSNVITRCMSLESNEPMVLTAVNITDLKKNDEFLLCTDGVINTLTEHKLSSILESDDSIIEQCSQLAHTSEDSSDNNTAILFRLGKVDRKPREVKAVDEATVIEPSDIQPKAGLFSRIFRH